MKICVPYKHMFGVIGLPRSGTTIINSVFESLDNGFCICEPILGSQNYREYVRYGKLNHIESLDPKDIVDQLENQLINNNGLSIGGYKEVYRFDKGENVKLLLQYYKLDFLIFVFRNPRCIFSSYDRLSLDHEFADTKWLECNYKSLFSLYKRCSEEFPTFLIKHEDFCNSEDKVRYLNNVFDGYLRFYGEFKIHKNNYILGDRNAVISDRVMPPNMELTNRCLHKPNMEYIDKNIMPLYNNMSDLQKF